MVYRPDEQLRRAVHRPGLGRKLLRPLSHCWLNSGADTQATMTLNYACTCANGTAPGLTYYARTMPTFICEDMKKHCIDDANGDAAAEKRCGDANKSTCGTLDPIMASKETDDKPTTTAATTGADKTIAATATSKPDATDSSNSSSGEGGGGGKPSLGWMAAVVAGIVVFMGALAGGFYWLVVCLRAAHEQGDPRRNGLVTAVSCGLGDSQSQREPLRRGARRAHLTDGGEASDDLQHDDGRKYRMPDGEI
ncbi:hypothetical protein PG996_005055 [Apiospora saccharicola]|uniref:DUF7707 domain-containing protein n=1 Tax=Apiospora saccharicola TaxID=335842 RepID=A0ABR1VLH2_9PEZI